MFNRLKFSPQDADPGHVESHVFSLARSGLYADLLVANAVTLVSHRMVSFKEEDGLDPERASALYLAPREKEVLLWAAHGKSAWETAQVLDLSETTVKSYIRNACSRLNVQNKTHAVAKCISEGLFRI